MRRFVLTLSRAFAFFGVLSAAVTLSAQSTSVITLANINANQVTDGLGFNITAGLDWQWAAVAAAGGTHARIMCSWATVEQQTAPPNNRSAGYVEDPECVKGFESAARYGIHPTIIAGYGAPYHQILTVTVPGGAAVGSTSIHLQFSSGNGGDTLANIKFPYDYICPLLVSSVNTNGRPTQCSGQFSGKFSSEGTLVTGVTLTDATHATVTLASALTIALPADTTPYMVSEILYPSTNSQDPNDPSVVAYANYANFLAKDMAAHGVTGDIEIWNEPPWKNDPWDWRPGLYDAGTYPGPAQSGANFGFAANLQHRTMPPGVTVTWNGTSGSGMSSLLGPQMLANSGQTLVQPSLTITKESFHPYGGGYGNPEVTLMSPTCLEAAASSTSYWGRNIYANGRNCYLPGEPPVTNTMQAVEWDDIAKLINPVYGIGHSVTETNNAPPAPGYQLVQARSNVRQLLGFEAMGISPVEFFQIWDGGRSVDPSYAFVTYDGNTFTPKPGYTALAGVMSDVNSIGGAPVTPYSASTLPSVTSYSGTYPLVAMHMVGSRANATANSDSMVMWQLTSCSSSYFCWFYINVGAGGPVTVNIPSGMQVTAVRNLTTRADVSYKTNGQTITLAVGDDPVEVLTDPTSATPTTGQSFLTQTTLALGANPTTSSYGAQVAVTAVVSPSSNKAGSTNGETIAFYDGSTQVASVPLASGVASFDTTSLSVGTHSLRAVYVGDKNFGGSSRTISFTVTAAAVDLLFAPVADGTYGTTSTVNVSASSISRGAISYAVVSGPARLSAATSSGATLSISGAGRVVVQANQQASTGYTALTAQTSFNVAQATPTISFRPIATQTYGGAPVTAIAGSASPGTITYSIASGPATISGNTVAIKGAGTVVVQASQAATTNYTTTSATLSFTVLQKAPQMSMRGVSPQVFGAGPIGMSATSTGPAAITYSIASGPASVSGNTVTLLGAGTIVVQASQAATTDYSAASTQTSFVVQPGAAGLSLNGFPSETFGVAPLQLQPTTLSPAQIVYRVASGPAVISGNRVVLTGTGWVVVQASQVSTTNYVGSTAQTSFRVNPGAPSLAFRKVADQMGLTAPFRVFADSPSSAAITYRVISGPANVAQNIVTVTGFGTVVLQASQAASGGYTSATARASFLVIPTDADVQ